MSGDAKMITTLTGDNEYLIQNFVHEKQRDYLEQYGEMAIERIDCEEVESERISESIQSLPFLVPSKLVILRNPGQNKKFTEVIEKVLDGIPEVVEVIIIEPKPDKRSIYYKTLKSKTDLHELKTLDNDGLAKWLITEAKNRGGSIALADARLLVDRIGTKQMQLSNELDKLLAYDSNINKVSIEKLTSVSPQSTIFELIEASINGQTERAIKLYEEQRKQKVEPQQIIAMLAWQLHVLAVVKAAGDRSSQQIASEAKLNPYVVTKTQRFARQLSFQDVKQWIGELFELDNRIKQTSVDVDQELQGFIMSLQKTPHEA